MQWLWRQEGPSTVREVLHGLSSKRPLAYTTVMTVLDNLHRKGAVQREMRGRAWLYQPVRTREQDTASDMRDLLDTAGDTDAALLHFVADLDQDDIARLRRVLDAQGDPEPEA